MKKTFSKAELVSFGNYLLSDERKKTIIHEENLNLVTHADVENWAEVHKNEENEQAKDDWPTTFGV